MFDKPTVVPMSYEELDDDNNEEVEMVSTHDENNDDHNHNVISNLELEYEIE